MARPQASDFLHSMRFHVGVVDGGNDVLAVASSPQAGFNSVSTPEVTIEAVEYKEGTDIWTRKYPGNPTVAEITLGRGVARFDSSFWDWTKTTSQGTSEYRADLLISHYGRSGFLGGDHTPMGSDIRVAAKTYKIWECFPVRNKVAADLEATTSEISIAEMDIAFEHFDVFEGEAP